MPFVARNHSRWSGMMATEYCVTAVRFNDARSDGIMVSQPRDVQVRLTWSGYIKGGIVKKRKKKKKKKREREREKRGEKREERRERRE